MADVFLMGTAGQSKWRDPIKAACAKHGITFFDPIVSDWNDESMRREVEALRTARILVMAITADTAGIASLAESGWAALSAVQRKQAFGLYIDVEFSEKQVNPMLTQGSMSIRDLFLGQGKQDATGALYTASARARKLVDGHAQELAAEFPGLDMYVAHSLQELSEWIIKTAKKRLRLPSR